MNTSRIISALVLSVGLTAGFVGCSKQERANASDKAKDVYSDVSDKAKDAYADVSVKAKDVYADSVASLSNAWDSVKGYSFEKRDEFRASAKSLSASMDAKISEIRANYSESKASASRKAAMNELKSSEADYKSKLDALGNATAATWDSAKKNVIAAWERLEASYRKARAE